MGKFNLGICGHLVTPLNTHQKFQSFEEKSGSMKYIIIIFMFMVLLTPPPLDALPQWGPHCACSDKTTPTNAGTILGACRNKDSTGKFMCYIEKSHSGCCEKYSQRLTNYCVNYSLCDGNDGNEDIVSLDNTGYY